MRRRDVLAWAACAVALCALVAAWAWLLRGGEPPARPVHHAYAPFTVEVSVRDR